jgi:hypothetical protein
MTANLEAEVRDLAARRDIYNCICTYMRAQDRLLPDLHLSAFHEDAFVDCGPYAGSAAGFVDFAQGLLGTMKASQHGIMQAHISVDGNRATGEVYFIAQHRITEGGEDKDLFMAGRYIDEYEDRGQGWKIARRLEIIDWTRVDPMSDTFTHDLKLHVGGRGREDFSVRRDWENLEPTA